MNCPHCGEECDRDEVDVGVGVIYGPFGCYSCGWSQDSQYDTSKGISPAQSEHPDFYVDPCGGMIRKSSIIERAEHFGIPKDLVESVFEDKHDNGIASEAQADDLGANHRPEDGSQSTQELS